jgi:putative nucleotidyltransferase with HDIG domain
VEITGLAESFNRMSHHVQDHVLKLNRSAQEKEQLFLGFVRAFLTAIEAKEPYTGGHSERVAAYAQAISRHLRENRELQERVWIAGLLHDVGKIGIDDRILNKGDAFTDEEYRIMQQHPVIGAEIVASIERLKDVQEAIRWHHEKWDGSGYPDGISGEKIPLMARIVAVADTFDAVTTQRVYQDPFTPEEALEILRKLTGKAFDARIVAAFNAAFEAGDIRVPKRPPRQVRRQEVSVTAAVHT